MAHGWYFLPNSILLKGQAPGFLLSGIRWLAAASRNLLNGQLLPLLIASGCTIVFIGRKDDEVLEPLWYANVILVVVLSFHALFASTWVFFRYEAYLVCLGVLILGASGAVLARTPAIWAAGRKRVIYAAYACLLLVDLTRVFVSLWDTSAATTNIYEQQYQMGAFVRRFYDGRTVVANDIGAISYLADIKLIDVWGLGTLEPARLRLGHEYNTDKIFQLSRDGGGVIAIVYDDWFQGFGGLPTQWARCGRWKIVNNVVAGSDAVSFYAVDPSATSDLIAHLRDFGAELPLHVGHDAYYPTDLPR
jgi:hypothetical protein